LNPVGFYGQLNGGLVHAIGQTLMEELPMADGRITVGSLADYKLPNSVDIPALTTVVLDSPAGHGPYNVRGVGNASIALPAPAIANAIADACGARVRELPITSERVWRELRSLR
jgi:putative selenate reductase molybdopterin-binding subunit